MAADIEASRSSTSDHQPAVGVLDSEREITNQGAVDRFSGTAANLSASGTVLEVPCPDMGAHGIATSLHLFS